MAEYETLAAVDLGSNSFTARSRASSATRSILSTIFASR
jgi:hypothetical protein